MGEKDTDNKGLTWTAPEYPFWRKTQEWYISTAIVGGACAAAAFLLDNFVFGIFIVVATFALLLLASRPPKKIEVVVNEKGVLIGTRRYPFENLESFWINKKEEPPRLIIKSKKVLVPLITVELTNIESGDVDAYLSHHLEREELHEPLLHKIMEYLGF